MTKLDEAIEHLTTTYGSLEQVALGYSQMLNPKEVQTRLAKAKPDTAEYIALKHLDALLRTPIVEPAPQESE